MKTLDEYHDHQQKCCPHCGGIQRVQVQDTPTSEWRTIHPEHWTSYGIAADAGCCCGPTGCAGLPGTWPQM